MGALSYIVGLVTMATAPEPVDLEWTAPPECPSRAEVMDRLRAELPDAESSGLQARMTIRKESGRFVLEARVGTDAGQSDRRLEASTCDELADATVVLITLALTNELGAGDETPDEDGPSSGPDEGIEATIVPVPESPPARDPIDDAPPPDEPDRAAPVQHDDEPRPSASPDTTPIPPSNPTASSPPTERRRRPRIEGRAGVFGGVAGLALPAVTGSIAGEGGVGGPRWEATLGAHYWVRRQAALGSGTRGRFELVAAQLRGCGVPSVGPIDVPLCGALMVGALLAAGTEGLARVDSAAHPWVALAASAGLRWWIGARWGLALRVEGLVAPARPSFEIGGLGPVCCSRAGLTGSAGVVGRWGRNGSGRVRTITPDASRGAPLR